MADINVTLSIVDGINADLQIGDSITADIGVGTVSRADEKVKYDTNDLASGFLSDKVVAGVGITLSEGVGADADKLKITSTALGSDELVKYDATDAAAGYLGAKIVAGIGISLAEGIGIDADKLVITSTAVGTDEKVKYDAGDVAAGYVADKIVAGIGISIAEGAGPTENKSVVTNSDTGSGAVSAHNIAFTHGNIHALNADAETATSIINLGIDEPGFRQALSAAQSEAIDRAARCLIGLQDQAIDTLAELSNPGQNEGIRLRASQVILDLAGKLHELRYLDERLSELEKVVQRGN